MSTDISRFDPIDGMKPRADGDWIRYDDHLSATAALREENATLRRICNGQSLQLSMMGVSSEAVAVVGEPVHPAILEANQLRAECERLRQQLNSANPQQQL